MGKSQQCNDAEGHIKWFFSGKIGSMFSWKIAVLQSLCESVY